MHESSEWPSVGLFSGTTNHLGNWDECMMISSNSIKGKYCLVEGTYRFDKLINDRLQHEAVEWPGDELSVWEILKMVSTYDVNT